MAPRAGVLFLALLVLLPVVGAAQSREPRFMGQYPLDGDPVAAAVSQDGPYLAVGTVSGVVLLDPEQKPLWQKPLASLVGVAITAPDVPQGPWVLAASSDRIYLYDSAGNVRLTSSVSRPVRTVGITPDGNRMVISEDRYVEVRDKDGLTIWNKDVGFLETRAAIGTDGSVVTLSADSATLWTPGGSLSRTVSYSGFSAAALSWRPTSVAVSGTRVVIGANDGTYLFDSTTESQTHFTATASSTPVAVQASPRIIAVSSLSGVTLRDIFGNLLKAPSPGGDVAALAISPDGRYLAMGLKDRRLALYDLGAVVPSFLLVNATPAATVLVDEQPKGPVPLRLEILPGPHRVVVSNSSLGEVPVTAVVPFGGQAEVFVNLSRLAYPSALEVNTAPPGADVAVDGSSLGRAPLTVSLVPGNRTLRVSLTGFAPYSATVSLSADNLTRLNVTLTPPGQGPASASSADTSRQEIPPNSISPPSGGRNATWEIKLVSPTPTPAPAPTKTPEPPGFEAAFAAAALVIAAAFRSRRKT